MEWKWMCIMAAIIIVALSVGDVFSIKAKEQTKQTAIQVIENGADEATVNRILNGK